MGTYGLRPIKLWVLLKRGRCTMVCTCDTSGVYTWRNTVSLGLRKQSCRGAGKPAKKRLSCWPEARPHLLTSQLCASGHPLHLGAFALQQIDMHTWNGKVTPRTSLQVTGSRGAFAVVTRTTFSFWCICKQPMCTLNVWQLCCSRWLHRYLSTSPSRTWGSTCLNRLSLVFWCVPPSHRPLRKCS